MLLQGIPCFFERFSLLSQEFQGFRGENNPCFFGGFPCLFPQKKQGKEDQGSSLCQSTYPPPPPNQTSLDHGVSNLSSPYVECVPTRPRGPFWECPKSASAILSLHRSSKNAVRRFFLYYDQVKICLIKSSDSPITRRKKRLMNWKIV